MIHIMKENESNNPQCADGRRPPKGYIFDDLDYLRQKYSPEQLREMWDAACPKSPNPIDGLIIMGTSDETTELPHI